MKEIEERVNMLEELFEGFVERVKVLENVVPEYLDTFLKHYNKSMTDIYGQIEKSNNRYDHSKIQQNIDEVKQILASTPKVITIRNSHHFGAWSKNLIIGVVVCILLTTSSVGTALYLNHRNNRLNDEAYNFWLIRALYPEAAKTILTKLEEDPNALVEMAKKEMAKQNAIIAAQAQAEQAEKQQQAAKENLKKAKSDQ
ncbi:hypothetical protein [Pedobacter nutrimenti]|uniref:Uncharacterized protein n=1 Tax=Pedobacter nutrimenti TaxID=1241337 RepID=A0A318UWU3_9SPHI|nr:hypothetical protein [Pedobacter nutrimenti]PYF76119.1 hypothetical protein B0O44_102675 [Pedobacter nutrimenti]